MLTETDRAAHLQTTLGSAELRQDFPILDQEIRGNPLIYLDNAATTQKPRSVLKAIRDYYENDNSNVHRGIHALSQRATEAYEGARERAAAFINASRSEEIVFTRGTTEGINLVAQSWGRVNLKPGDKILLTEMEHHSNIVPWQLLAEQIGVELVYLPITGEDGMLDLNRLDEFLSRDVKVFAMTHISNTLGTINPVAWLCQRARRQGIVTVVDAAQSAGHSPLDVQAIGCDFLAFSGHKMCAPTGIGVLYGRKDLLEAMPPYQGGGEMILSVDFHKTTFKRPPLKFEAGTPNIAGAIGLKAAMDYIDTLGREAIFEHDCDLGRYAYQQFSQLDGIRLYGPVQERAGLLSFLLTDVHAHDLVTATDQKGLALRGGHHCNQPLMRKLGIESTARVSGYFYNTRKEIDQAVEIVNAVQRFFSG